MYKKCIPECGVLSVNKTVEWYKNNLEFDIIMTLPESGKFEWALMKKDDVEIMFQTKNSLDKEIPSLKENNIAGSIILYIEIENFKEL